MRLTFLSVFVAAGLLVGCASTPDDDATSSGAGAAAEAGDAAAARAGAARDGVTAEGVTTEVRPGTVEDFVVNVGDRVFFGFDRYDLDNEARDTLEKQIAWLLRYPQLRITLEGHADERGTREYNLALGERRATSMRDYMIALGVDPGRVTTISYGKERPVDPRSDEEAWTKNRRGVTVLEDATAALTR